MPTIYTFIIFINIRQTRFLPVPRSMIFRVIDLNESEAFDSKKKDK